MKKKATLRALAAMLLCLTMVAAVPMAAAAQGIDSIHVGIDNDDINNPDEPSNPPSYHPDEPDYPPVIVDNEGGNVEVTPSEPEEGDVVEIRAIPDEGYEVDEVEVLDEDGEKVEVTMTGDNTFEFIQPKGTVQISVTFQRIPCDGGADCPSAAYDDLSTGAWYHESTDYVIRHGLMTGTSETLFEPDTTTTRAMVVSIFNRMENNPTADSDVTFADVDSDAWYADTVRWAAAEGLVAGFEDGTFRPNDPISREQLAAMIHNYAAYKGYDVSARADLSVYDDENQISAWAYDVLSWANATDMITGMSSTTINPKDSATRVQLAAILMRFCEADWDVITN